MSFFPASGIGTYTAGARLIIRFARHGCTNREFFHIVVSERKAEQFDPIVEQIGTFDPFANEYNEKLMSLNFERARFWLGKGADVSKPVAELFGLSGLLPIHPRTYMTAWRNRREDELQEATAAAAAAAASLQAKSSG